MDKDIRQVLHNSIIPIVLTAVWGIGGLLSLDSCFLSNWRQDEILFNIGLVGSIFMIELIFFFLDLSISNSDASFTNRVVLLSTGIFICVMICIYSVIGHINRECESNKIGLFIFIISLCWIKLQCLKLQSNPSGYFKTKEQISPVNG